MQGFNTGIVPTVPFPAHAGRHAPPRPDGRDCILAPLIGMMEHACRRLIPGDGLVEGLEDHVLRHAVAHRPRSLFP